MFPSALVSDTHHQHDTDADADITELEVVLENEEGNGRLIYHNRNKDTTPSLVELSSLLGRKCKSVYDKILHLRKDPRSASVSTSVRIQWYKAKLHTGNTFHLHTSY